jgi:anti-sigma factor (TIGR02949 family)
MQHLNPDVLIDYLHHELPPGQDAKVLAHLEACARCARELDVEASITDRLRAAARADELELPLGMRSAIIARISAVRPNPWDRLSAVFRPVVLLPVAAVLTAVAIFVGPVLQPQQNTALPVSYYLQQYAVHSQQNPLADRGTVIMSSFDDGPR